jgi:hypothetical protein
LMRDVRLAAFLVSQVMYAVGSKQGFGCLLLGAIESST